MLPYEYPISTMKKLGKKKVLQGSQLEFFLSPDTGVTRDFSLSIADVYAGLEKILHRSLRPIHSKAQGVKFQLRAKVLLEKYSFENDKQVMWTCGFPQTACLYILLFRLRTVYTRQLRT